MAKQNKPAIRFKGFTDAWEQRKLGALCVEFKSGDFISASDIAENEAYPVYGGNGLRGFTNHYNHDGEYALIGRQGALCGNVNYAVGKSYFTEHAVAVRANKTNQTRFLYYLFSTMNLGQYSGQSAQPGLAVGNLVELENVVPSKPEQEKIASFLSSLDNLITLHQRKYDKLQVLKKAMLEKMFPKNGSSVPEIRFKGFTDAWEQRKVSEVAEICAGGTPSTGIEKYWHPKEIPWLSSGEVHKKYITYTDNKISVEGLNNSSARMIPANSVLIALAGQGKTRGTVAINRISLTTNQSIAAMIFSKEIVPEFVFCNLENRYEEIRRMSSGDGSRGGLNKQIVGEIEIPYTSKEEQAKIGAYFSKLDYLITLHQRELEKLQNIKKSMLEKMFV
ncbi:restriction endonuclease subunit S [Gemmiger sp.]|uniref:restriction endonuclease subunit S n=1 Tax=Gemmiger sp. TaxID=2049027 RepID=UPI003FD7D11D